MYRLWTGGAKLQNKVLSSETGAYGGYAYTEQDHLMEAYNLFAAGFNRIVWHIWSAQYGPGTDNRWPHYTASGAVYASFYAFGPHEPSSVDYPSFNDHLGRICQLLREGVSRTDVGMIYMNYQQPMPTSGNHGGENWMLNHTTGFFPSTTLQDNGYTYDYFSPDFLTADGVSYAAETGTLEQFRKEVLDALKFMDYAPVLFLSAKTGQRVHTVIDMVDQVWAQTSKRIPTGVLNDVLNDATADLQPPATNGRRLKIYYITQQSACPPTFILFVNEEALMHFAYQRYLENYFRKTFDSTGTPIRFILREKTKEDK